jgi:hypothetical protein
MSDEIDDRDSAESDADAGADDEDDEDFEGEDILIEIIGRGSRTRVTR